MSRVGTAFYLSSYRRVADPRMNRRQDHSSRRRVDDDEAELKISDGDISSSRSRDSHATQRSYVIKITLSGSEPPIWRRIETWDVTLELHELIQIAMGWTNFHLH